LSQSNTALGKLFDNVVLRVVVYYAVLFASAAALWRLSWTRVVVRGSLDALRLNEGLGSIGTSAQSGVAPSVNETTFALTVAAAMIGAIVLALPVAWIYALTRRKRGYQQSVVHTLMILPPLVAGVVVMVKYSIALAFGLAGIVAAVRFRNTLEDSKDAVYVFFATALGLAAAVQLPVAAVISVLFNALVLALWFTDFGKSAAFEGTRAQRRLEETRAKLRQTGSFVAMLDNEIFEKMSPEQLELAADRAWRRRRRLGTEAVDDDEMQRRNVLLRLRTHDPDASRVAVEPVFDEFLKNWHFGGVLHEEDGTHVLEYAVQLKKTARSAELLDVLQQRSQLIGAEIK
jgi:hypothetical protein